MLFVIDEAYKKKDIRSLSRTLNIQLSNLVLAGLSFGESNPAYYSIATKDHRLVPDQAPDEKLEHLQENSPSRYPSSLANP